MRIYANINFHIKNTLTYIVLILLHHNKHSIVDESEIFNEKRKRKIKDRRTSDFNARTQNW